MSQNVPVVRLGSDIAFVLAVIAAVLSAIVGLIATPWLLAAILDGRLEGAVAGAGFLALFGTQVALVMRGDRLRGTERSGSAVLYLVASAFPLLVLIFFIAL